jgi:hypothetical protein
MLCDVLVILLYCDSLSVDVIELCSAINTSQSRGSMKHI